MNLNDVHGEIRGRRHGGSLGQSRQIDQTNAGPEPGALARVRRQ